jgi:lactate dehydrogenase-like 2-hydroxyacid dehydrogenase
MLRELSVSKPAVLLMQPHLGFLSAILEPDYTVWRFWEGPPLEAVNAIEAVVVAGEFPLDKPLAQSLPKLGLIACLSSGYDGIDVAWAKAHGLKVSHSPGVNHDDVADHAMGLLLGAWRRIVAGDGDVRGGGWSAVHKRVTPSLAGRKLGVVGLGEIGAAIARRAEPFGLEIAWWGPREKPDAPWPRRESLIALARESDILAVACRATAQNVKMVDKAVIEALGAKGLLINVARGQIVDEAATIAALKAGTLGMAALDVFEEEPTPAGRWAGVPNTVLTPHIAGAATGAVQRMIALTRENLRRYFAGEELANPAAE